MERGGGTVMGKTITAPATRRLKILQDCMVDSFVGITGSVVDVPARFAAELLRTGQGEPTTAHLRLPVWASCPRCRSSWIHHRLVDGRWLPRWTDDADQSPCWAECRCGVGWLR